MFRNFLSSDWLTAIGTIGATFVALFFGVYNLIEIKRQQRTGLTIKDIDPTGVGQIINNSKIDYSIQLSKYILADGTDANKSIKIHGEIEKPDKKYFLVLIKDKDIECKELIPKQSISPEETLSFHIHNLDCNNVSLVFILLELVMQEKRRYLLYRFACRKNFICIQEKYHSSLHPYNQWFKVYSFEV